MATANTTPVAWRMKKQGAATLLRAEQRLVGGLFERFVKTRAPAAKKEIVATSVQSSACTLRW